MSSEEVIEEATEEAKIGKTNKMITKMIKAERMMTTLKSEDA